MTKITIETKDGCYSVQENVGDLDIYEMAQLIEQVLLASGYAKSAIDDILKGDE